MARTDDISQYLNRPYSVQVFLDVDDDGDRFYVALHPELEGCVTQGNTPDEAIELLKYATASYITALIKRGVPVPEADVMRLHTAPGTFEAHISLLTRGEVKQQPKETQIQQTPLSAHSALDLQVAA